MEYKYLNLFLLFTITILLVMCFLLNTSSDGFQNPEDIDKLNEQIAQGPKTNNTVLAVNNDDNEDNDDGSNDMEYMRENLSNSESLCEEMSNRSENKKLLKQYKENHRVLELLTDQKKRIEELTNVVNYLRVEKKKRETMVNECRANTQDNLNADTEIVKTIIGNGLVNEPLKLNLGVTDDLKEELYNAAYNKCPPIDTEKNIEADKLKGKCVGCNVDTLKKTNLSDFE
jgi:hypothetical protein